MQPANLLVDKMYRTIKEEMDLSHNNEVAVLVNGLGSTTLLELSIVYNELQKHLEKEGISVHEAEIQQFCTCQEMGGLDVYKRQVLTATTAHKSLPKKPSV